MSESIKAQKTKKPQGPIRWNAIIPFLIVSFLVYLYFLMFFDSHIKSAIEWAGYKVVGAEVNVGTFKSSFTKGQVQISKIQITNSEKPDYNSLELADIRFDLNWDALLRVKFVIEEIAVEGVQFMSKRAYRGKVAPPEPPSNEPSFTQQLQNRAINKLDKENQNNLLGDIAQFLKTGSFDAQLTDLKSQLGSKKLIDDLNLKWKNKQTEWQAKVKTLPSSEDLNLFKERFNKIKFQDFGSLQELDTSVKEAESLINDINARTKQVAELKQQLDTDIKSIDQDKKSVEQQIKTDIDTLKSRFQIPKIDAGNFAKELFMSYLTPYVQKLDQYKAMAQKYLPPKYAKMVAGEKTDKVDDTIQPMPRTSGVSYEFPIKNGYPLFWIQKVALSSKSNAQADYGDITGLIQHITSNQSQIGHPTSMKVNGSFKKSNIEGITLNALFDNRSSEAKINFDFGVAAYPISDISLMNSNDGQIKIPSTVSNLVTRGEIIAFKNYDLELINTFSNVNFDIQAKDATISEILKSTLGTINKFDLQAHLSGELKNLDVHIKSSLGADLEKAFQNLLQAKIKEANEKLQAAVNAEVDKLKAQLNEQIETVKKQAESEIKKVQAQIEEQKKQVEQKIAQAKKDFDDKINKAKKDAEDEARKKLEQEVKKQAEELKKKLGL